ncbi:hypothetical protein PC122_g16569 [Phytophthora cactorum]|nr:hypothetical protein PC122_g16569 [Phytophthora cactorum]
MTKGSTGIQLHHSYVKPGCKVRGGKQGVDYFNGEGTLLAFVRSDKELCARPNISNIMFVICLRKKPRLDPAALVLVFQKISSAKKASDLSKKAAPPSKKSTTPATRTANSSAKAPVKKKKRRRSS